MMSGKKRHMSHLRQPARGRARNAPKAPGPQAFLLVILTLIGLSQALGVTFQQAGERPSEGTEREQGPRRVALCFYGVTRSLRWTLPSIKERLIDVMRDAGMQVDVFVHTYDMREYENHRDGKGAFEYSSFAQDFKILNATRSLVTNQDDFDLAWPDPLSLSHFDWAYPSSRKAGTVRNIFRAYWSMTLAWGLLAEYSMEGDFEYDAVVLARPDVWFQADIDLPSHTFPLPERVVFLPSFGSSTARVNDKFSYGSVSAMRVVMHRIATFMDPEAFSYRRDVYSEWVFTHHLLVNDISPQLVPFPLARVRLTGEVAEFDYPQVKEACRSGSDKMSCEIIRLGFRLPTSEANLQV